MNKKQVIELLKAIKEEDDIKYCNYKERYYQALDIAIESLQDEVEELEKMESKALEDYSEETIKKAVSKFSKTIKQLNNRIQGKDNEWVDVRDRLPSEDEEVLTTDKLYNISIARYCNKKFFDNRGKENHYVIAWKKVEPCERNIITQFIKDNFSKELDL